MEISPCRRRLAIRECQLSEMAFRVSPRMGNAVHSEFCRDVPWMTLACQLVLLPCRAHGRAHSDHDVFSGGVKPTGCNFLGRGVGSPPRCRDEFADEESMRLFRPTLGPL